MTLRELDRLFLKASRDLDARQRARIKELKGLDRTLFNEIIKRIVGALSTDENGRIVSRISGAAINNLIDQAFAIVERAGLRDFQKNALSDIRAMIQNGQDYFGAMSTREMKVIDQRVLRSMRKRIGLDPKTGKPIEGGPFDRFFDNEPARTSVKQAVANAIASKAPMRNLLQVVLPKEVIGTKESPGVLSKAFGNLVYDTYQQVDRATNKEYATRLELDTFIYAGGLIETSRDFCKKRNNKVFTEEEAEQWRRDCQLPRKAKEPKCPEPVWGYDPLVELGRWSCRHRTRYISRELAEQMRPDMK